MLLILNKTQSTNEELMKKHFIILLFLSIFSQVSYAALEVHRINAAHTSMTRVGKATSISLYTQDNYTVVSITAAVNRGRPYHCQIRFHKEADAVALRKELIKAVRSHEQDVIACTDAGNNPKLYYKYEFQTKLK